MVIVSRQTLPLTVNYDPTAVVQMIERLGRVDYSIVHAAWLPSRRRSTRQLEATLVCFGREIKSGEVTAELNELGLRAGKLVELVAFGIQHADIQHQHRIAAPGSAVRILGASATRTPCLHKDDLYLYCWEGQPWGGTYHFIAFHE